MEFTFNGISSHEMKLNVTKSPSFSIAERRSLVRHPEGLDKQTIKDLGSISYIMHLDMSIEFATLEDLDNIKMWLQGRGWFERRDYEGKRLLVEFQSSLQITYISDGVYRVYSTVFVVDPKWQNIEEVFVAPTSNKFVNEGTALAEPLIKLTRTTDDVVDITIGKTRFIYDFLGDEHVYIDTKSKDVYYEVSPATPTQQAVTLNKMRQITIGYDYPTFNVGDNEIIFNSGSCDITAKGKDRWY